VKGLLNEKDECSVICQLMDVILLAQVYGRPRCQEGVMQKRDRVTLTVEERQELPKLVSVGKGAARRLMRARVFRSGRSGTQLLICFLNKTTMPEARASRQKILFFWQNCRFG
jgi:hypothetical protein